MTPSGDMPAPQVLDKWVVTSVLRDDMKVTGGIRGHGTADVGEGEIQRVLARGSKARELHGDSVLEKLFDQGNIDAGRPAR